MRNPSSSGNLSELPFVDIMVASPLPYQWSELVNSGQTAAKLALGTACNSGKTWRYRVDARLVTPYLAIYILVKATWTTLRRNGIEWRGTFYPLPKLKESNARIMK